MDNLNQVVGGAEGAKGSGGDTLTFNGVENIKTF